MQVHYNLGAMEIKDVIIRLRETLKLSQSELADTIGVNQATVSRWEHGESVPSPLANQKLGRLVKKVLKV